MYAMDPGGVRGVGGRLGQVGQRVRGVADPVTHLRAPTAAVGVHDAVTAFVEVWGDALLALATELRILDELCACSSGGVLGEDEAARTAYVHPADAARRASLAG